MSSGLRGGCRQAKISLTALRGRVTDVLELADGLVLPLPDDYDGLRDAWLASAAGGRRTARPPAMRRHRPTVLVAQTARESA